MYTKQQKALMGKYKAGDMDNNLDVEAVSNLMNIYDIDRQFEFKRAYGEWSKLKSVKMDLDYWLEEEDRKKEEERGSHEDRQEFEAGLKQREDEMDDDSADYKPLDEHLPDPVAGIDH